MTNLEKYILAVFVVVILAEVVPAPINAVLFLVLVGLVVTQYQSFSSLLNQIGSLTTGGNK